MLYTFTHCPPSGLTSYLIDSLNITVSMHVSVHLRKE